VPWFWTPACAGVTLFIYYLERIHMDPATLALLVSGLGAGLGAAFTKLLDKGLIDPALDTGLEALREWLKRGYNQKKDEAGLRKAVEAAIQPTGGEAVVGTRLGRVFNALKDKPARAQLVAAAAIEMVRDDPARLPPDLLKELDLPDDQRAPFAKFLFALRNGLSGLEPYAAGIRYADQLDARHLLEGLYERVSAVADTVTETPDGKALRVQIAPIAPDARELERPYLDNVLIEYGGLSLESRTRDEAVRSDDLLRLEQIYIALNTTEARFVPVTEAEQKGRGRAGPTGVELQPAPLSALRAVMESRRLVLLGDPGSGKSTFAQHLCLCLAGARRDPHSAWPDYFRAGDVEAWELPHHPLPIFLRLRLFAHDTDSLPNDPRQMGRAEHLTAHLQKEFARLGRRGLESHLLTTLENGQALVVLDGLDEVTSPSLSAHQAQPDSDRRQQVAQAIQHFARRYPYTRLIVTCRVKQYPLDAQGRPTAAWKLPELPVSVIADFGPDQVKDFLVHWFAEQRARGRLPEADDKRDSLLTALTTRPELAQLAPKPILLTQMALVHTHKKLPDSRVEVYRECSDLLLWEWERLRSRQAGRQSEAAPDFLQSLIPTLRRDEVENALDQAVFEAHAAGDPEIPAERLRCALRDLFRDVYKLPPDLALGGAEKFRLHWLNTRNGLLVPAGEDTYTVPHPSFREFMAARWLRNNSLPHPQDREIEENWKLSGPRLVHDNYDRWREVFRFTAGLDSPAEVAIALHELCPEPLDDDPAEVRKLLLAGEVARDVGGPTLSVRSKLGKQVVDRLESHLLHLLRDTDDAQPYPEDKPRFTSPNDLPPKTRLAAGELLNDLGWLPPDLDDFVHIPSTLDLRLRTSDFYLNKYPVTNLQYARFLSAPDYADESFWLSVQGFDAEGQPLKDVGQEALKWFRENGGKDRRPRYWDDARFGLSRRLFPVVGVTWYEAAAYCAWLGLHRKEYVQAVALPENLVFRLPLEDEWADAAGGATGERYPWQKDPAPMTAETMALYANTGESDLGGTTPVCMYPAGMSLAGVMDMSGNVWEWQANLYKKGESWRAVRGGSWYLVMGLARVAVRDDYHPHYDWYNLGFRVVAAPVSRS
jgi:formylglycine-generating enzyme required for sulfatase activity